MVGNIENAKQDHFPISQNLSKDSKQQKAALGIKTIFGQKVTSPVMGEKKWMRGVITGIPMNVSTDTIKKSISGAEVID